MSREILVICHHIYEGRLTQQPVAELCNVDGVWVCWYVLRWVRALFELENYKCFLI